MLLKKTGKGAFASLRATSERVTKSPDGGEQATTVRYRRDSSGQMSR